MNIYGLGLDLVEIDRIENMLNSPSGNAFTERFFSERERDLFNSKKFSAQTIAANFAAKEALSKALGTGFSGFPLKEISVLRDPLGKPYIEFSETLAQKFKKLSFEISLTHTRTTAGAVVLAFISEEKP